MKQRIANWLAQSDAIYRKCLGMVDRHRGDNQGDMLTNGEFAVMRQLLPNAHVVFDVGANRGDWSKLALQVNPTVALHCFEPSHSTFELLKAHAWPSNVTLNALGLSDANGQRDLFVIGDGIMNSVYDRFQSGVVETVTFTTLDRYAHDMHRIDFVKIDVEGHELGVLRGSGGMLRAGRISAVQFEYGGAYLDARVQLKDVFEFVLDTNPAYSFYKIMAGGLKLVSRYDRSLETFQLSNWICRLNRS